MATEAAAKVVANADLLVVKAVLVTQDVVATDLVGVEVREGGGDNQWYCGWRVDGTLARQ